MELTEKCKEDFKEYLFNNYTTKEIGGNWGWWLEKVPNSFKYGVYVDFFDSVGIDLTIKLCGYLKYDYSIKDKISNSLLFTEYDWSLSRNEARIKAIKKANEIYNK